MNPVRWTDHRLGIAHAEYRTCDFNQLPKCDLCLVCLSYGCSRFKLTAVISPVVKLVDCVSFNCRFLGLGLPAYLSLFLHRIS